MVGYGGFEGFYRRLREVPAKDASPGFSDFVFFSPASCCCQDFSRRACSRGLRPRRTGIPGCDDMSHTVEWDLRWNNLSRKFIHLSAAGASLRERRHSSLVGVQLDIRCVVKNILKKSVRLSNSQKMFCEIAGLFIKSEWRARDPGTGL